MTKSPYFRFALGLVLLSSCASEPPAPPPTPHPSARHKKVTSSDLGKSEGTVAGDAREYGEIQKLYSSQAYDLALSRLEGFEQRNPSSSFTTQAENLRGLCLLLTHRAPMAIEQFQKAIQNNFSNPTLTPFLEYNLAKAQLESGDVVSSEKTASLIEPEKLDSDNRLKYHFLRAEIYTKKNMDLEASKELLNAGQGGTPITPEVRKAFENALNGSLPKLSKDQLADLSHDYAASPLSNIIVYHMTGKQEAQIIADLPVDPKAIGVLLPLKGKFARFGQKNLQAIEEAFHIFDSSEEDSGIQLVIEDSGEDPSQAIAALNRLVMKEHVAAVIGPLLSKGIDQVAHRAQELGVPLISLARHSGTAEGTVVEAGLTLQAQADEIARYAIQNRGLRRFAILYSKDKTGEESAQRFWDAVESYGGQIVGIESYAPGETDFREPVDKLSGLYYTEARQDELDALAEQRKVNQIKKKTRKTEQYFNLPPIVDYEAVFVPDDPKVSGQILPTFAYRDVEHIQFLGTSAWSSPEFIQRAQNNAEGALFVDAFFAGSQAPRIRKFIESYHSQFSGDPSGMDAVAYDAGLVVQHAVKGFSGSFSRADLLDRIRHTRDVKGVTGLLSYKDGQIVRDLRVLAVEGGQVVEQKR